MSNLKQYNNHLFVEMPKDSHSYEIYENNVIGGYCIMYLLGNPDYACEYSPNLPQGSYSIVGLAKDLTEGQWRGIVDSYFGDMIVKGCYKNYESGIMECKTATDSGLSLLKSLGLENKNVLILKINSNEQ